MGITLNTLEINSERITQELREVKILKPLNSPAVMGTAHYLKAAEKPGYKICGYQDNRSNGSFTVKSKRIDA